MVIWAGNNILAKAALNDSLLPLAYVFVRFLIVTVVLGVWLRVRHTPFAIDRADWPRFLVTAITGYALYNSLFMLGLARSTAFSTAIIVAMGPIFTLVFTALFRIETVYPIQWLGVIAAFAGILIFVGQDGMFSLPTLGDALNMAAAASFAIYGLTARPLVRKYGSPLTTFWSCALGLVLVAPFAAPAVANQGWTDLSPIVWTCLFYAGVLSMLVAYTVWGWAISRLGPGRVVPYLFLPPILTGILAWLILDERFGRSQVIGALLVMSGIAIALLAANRRPRTATS